MKMGLWKIASRSGLMHTVKMGLLQNSFLQRPFFALCEVSLVAKPVEKISKFYHLDMAKLTEANFPIFLWITFIV